MPDNQSGERTDALQAGCLLVLTIWGGAIALDVVISFVLARFLPAASPHCDESSPALFALCFVVACGVSGFVGSRLLAGRSSSPQSVIRNALLVSAIPIPVLALTASMCI